MDLAPRRRAHARWRPGPILQSYKSSEARRSPWPPARILPRIIVPKPRHVRIRTAPDHPGSVTNQAPQTAPGPVSPTCSPPFPRVVPILKTSLPGGDQSPLSVRRRISTSTGPGRTPHTGRDPRRGIGRGPVHSPPWPEVDRMQAGHEGPNNHSRASGHPPRSPFASRPKSPPHGAIDLRTTEPGAVRCTSTSSGPVLLSRGTIPRSLHPQPQGKSGITGLVLGDQALQALPPGDEPSTPASIPRHRLSPEAMCTTPLDESAANAPKTRQRAWTTRSPPVIHLQPQTDHLQSKRDVRARVETRSFASRLTLWASA